MPAVPAKHGRSLEAIISGPFRSGLDPEIEARRTPPPAPLRLLFFPGVSKPYSPRCFFGHSTHPPLGAVRPLPPRKPGKTLNRFWRQGGRHEENPKQRRQVLFTHPIGAMDPLLYPLVATGRKPCRSLFKRRQVLYSL